MKFEDVESHMKMEEFQSPDSQSNAVEQAELNVLDIMITLVENFKLLIIGPLLVGVCALGLGFMLPKTFESVAVLQADQSTASLMTTAAVLDPVAIKLGIHKDASAEDARRELQQSVKTVVGKSDKLLTLTVLAPTPHQAQAKANALLEQTYVQSRPKGSVRARLELQLADVTKRLKDSKTAADNLFERLGSTTASSVNNGTELARGYADLLNVMTGAQRQSSELQTQLEGLSESQLVQAPTRPQKPSQPKKALLAIGATLATGLALLLFVFMRQALRNTAKDAESAGKLGRIRRALGLK